MESSILTETFGEQVVLICFGFNNVLGILKVSQALAQFKKSEFSVNHNSFGFMFS